MRPAELKAMMRLGLLAEEANPIDAFLLWGRLVNDPVLWQRRLLEADSTILPPLEAALAKLTPVEVVALRQRLDAAEKAK